MKEIKYKKIILNWLVPSLAAILIFVFVRPVLAEIVTSDELMQYISQNNLEVGDETVDGYRQVYYIFNDEKVFVTDFARKNSHDPKVNKEYMVWVTDINGAGQIFLYHIPSDTITALTNSSTNIDPSVDENGNVVWTRWVGDTWQIFFYDGMSIRQLTDGDPSVYAHIANGKIVFNRQDKDKEWRAVEYITSNRQANTLLTGLDSKFVELENGEPIFPLKIAREKREAEQLAREERLREIREQREREQEEKRLEAELAKQAEEEAQADETASSTDETIPPTEQPSKDSKDETQEEQVDTASTTEEVAEDTTTDETTSSTEETQIDETASTTEEITSSTDETVSSTEETTEEPEEELPTEPETVTEEDVIEELEAGPIIEEETTFSTEEITEEQPVIQEEAPVEEEPAEEPVVQEEVVEEPAEETTPEVPAEEEQAQDEAAGEVQTTE